MPAARPASFDPGQSASLRSRVWLLVEHPPDLRAGSDMRPHRVRPPGAYAAAQQNGHGDHRWRAAIQLCGRRRARPSTGEPAPCRVVSGRRKEPRFASAMAGPRRRLRAQRRLQRRSRGLPRPRPAGCRRRSRRPGAARSASRPRCLRPGLASPRTPSTIGSTPASARSCSGMCCANAAIKRSSTIGPARRRCWRSTTRWSSTAASSSARSTMRWCGSSPSRARPPIPGSGRS